MRERPDEAIDIGHDVWLTWFVWSPDRDLNPQYLDVPDIDPMGVTVWHPRPDNGEQCAGAICFDLPGVRDRVGPNRPLWQVVSLDPLHVEPSVLCTLCGHHGFIRAGSWQPA